MDDDGLRSGKQRADVGRDTSSGKPLCRHEEHDPPVSDQLRQTLDRTSSRHDPHRVKVSPRVRSFSHGLPR